MTGSADVDGTAVETTDVIIVGAGPGGSTAAFHMARHGLRVLLLEKTEFPREKVCGDGLTPRAVKQLVKLGIRTHEPSQAGPGGADPRSGNEPGGNVVGGGLGGNEPGGARPEGGWLRNKGLRIIGGGVRMELDWPELASFPDYGLTRTRLDFDHLLAKRATEAGAELRTGHNVTGPVFDSAGRVGGVTAVAGGEQVTFHAPLVVAADGVSGRFPLGIGLPKREDRPIGVAVRRYYRSDTRHDDDYLESWLELRSREGGDTLLPGYGWIFGMGDGRVNVGLGVLNSSVAFGKTNYRRLLVDWLGATPPDWGLAEEANAAGPILGAALPMGFSRVPHYSRGTLLVGDSGGMVNPFNGEGIAYAMESGELAAEIAVHALARPPGPAREHALRAYSSELKARYGGYYRLGNAFVKVIGNPHLMKIATRHGMPHPVLMRFVLKLLANLTDPRGGDAMDRIINAMTKVAPAV